MTLTQILAGVRTNILADTKQPYLWGDAELVDYLNQAINEVTAQKKLFVESVVPAICVLNVLAADLTADYVYDQRIVEILRAKIRSQTLYMWRTDKMTLDYSIPDWRHLTTGTPRWFLTDWQEGSITISPKSNVDDFVDMTVYRLPLNQMDVNQPDASPEIRFEHHTRFYNGIAARAYQKDDTQCLDPKKGEKHEALWKVDMVEIAKTRQKFQDSYHFAQVAYGAV